MAPSEMSLGAPVPVAPAAAQPASPGAGDVTTAPPEIPETRQLTLEYPTVARAGDSNVVDLTFEVLPPGKTGPAAASSGLQGPNVYDTHTVVAEATVELPGVDVTPTGPVSEPLPEGGSAAFRWRVLSTTPGAYDGTVWLVLIFTDKVTGEQRRMAVSAQPIEVQSGTLLGLSGNAARVAGGLGLVGAGVLDLPLADEAIRWMSRRIRRRNSASIFV